MGAPTVQGGPGPRRRRPGLATLATGLTAALASAYLTTTINYPTGLGVMLGLITLYALAAYLVFSGIMRLRGGPEERDPVGADFTPGTRSVQCAVLGHKEAFSPRTATQPAGFRCRRCGAFSPRHINVGHAWMCELPLADHRYDHVGQTADAPQYWRCRRCGKRRYNAPLSAGESLDATQATLRIFKGYDD